MRLHGPKRLTGFKLYATSVNIVVVPCKRTQHAGPNNVACCWPTMLLPFAWALRADSVATKISVFMTGDQKVFVLTLLFQIRIVLKLNVWEFFFFFT